MEGRAVTVTVGSAENVLDTGVPELGKVPKVVVGSADVVSLDG